MYLLKPVIDGLLLSESKTRRFIGLYKSYLTLSCLLVISPNCKYKGRKSQVSCTCNWQIKKTNKVNWLHVRFIFDNIVNFFFFNIMVVKYRVLVIWAWMKINLNFDKRSKFIVYGSLNDTLNYQCKRSYDCPLK